MVKSQCQIMETEQIIDSWNINGETRTKLVGQLVKLNVDDRIYTISNFHLDYTSAHESFPIVTKYALRSDFIVGDFNRHETTIIRGIGEQIGLVGIVILPDCQKFMIDHIFKVCKSSVAQV